MPAIIRNFKDSDFPSILELIKELEGDQKLLYMHYGDGDFLSWLKKRQIEVLVAEDDGEIVGSVAYNDGYWGEEIEWLLVCRVVADKLIEEKLVREGEKRVKRGEVFTSVDARDLPRVSEWLRLGYVPDGGLYYMLAKLAGLKAVPSLAGSVLLRSLKVEEEEEFVRLVNAGFGWERVKVGDIQKWMVDSPPFDERWVQVAEADGKLVSTVVAKPDSGYSKVLGVKRGYLGPATTLPEYRGRNIASALTVRAMNSLFSEGFDSVCLFTSETNDSSVKMLRKIGFEVGVNWKFMRKYL